VWKLDEERGLVITTDFFTPIVDDPFDYGLIAAANSLSDIYAMGGTPFLALNITALPPQLPVEIGQEILRGGAEKAKEAGVVIAGGHTIQDKEPKYGLVALGIVPLDRMLTKGGMQPGDTLFLSKPIGSGVIATGIKKQITKPAEAEEAIEWMKCLNKDAASLAIKHGAKAATDITGFGLMGHAWEMVQASNTGLMIKLDAVPLYSGTARLAKEWCFAGGTFDNKEYFEKHVTFAKELTDEERMTMFDSQTSGGLLFAIPAEKADACAKAAEDAKLPLWKIGEVTTSGRIEVN
jgi:selenide,water dikinase